MEYIPFMTKISSKQIVFKAIISAILTHNNFERKKTIVPMHRDLKQH